MAYTPIQPLTCRSKAFELLRPFFCFLRAQGFGWRHVYDLPLAFDRGQYAYHCELNQRRLA